MSQVSSGLNCGIVGLPNVGKSTLFNAITESSIPASNFPFCTIDPNVGVVEVKDNRLQELQKIVKSQKIIPSVIQITDIAGLVRGASKGEGLGNQFLSHIRHVSAILHVVRCFDDENTIHVHGHVNPVDDAIVIETELCLADLQSVERMKEKFSRLSKINNKDGEKAKECLESAEIMYEFLSNGKMLNMANLSEEALVLAREYQLITIKPMLYVANVDSLDNPLLEKFKDYAKNNGCNVVPICAKLEQELSELDSEQDKCDFLNSMGWNEPGLDRLIKAGYILLNLETMFTVGPKEIHAWTLPKGSLAPKAASVIHTDFEKGFIRVEVFSYDDFINNGGELGAKNMGLMRVEGKDYIIKDGDIVHFRVNK